MKELKTLKDLQSESAPEWCIVVDEIKAEVIKWAKELGTKKYNEDGYPQARINIKWIKHFFNLTEEDLK